MAVGPEQLDKRLQKEADEYEESIDIILISKSLIDNSYVNIAIPSGLSRNVFRILKIRYENAGWASVSWESDQRDGDWIRFRR